MPVVRFTATRALIVGVSVNDTVTYDLPVAYAGINRQRTVFATQRRSLSGRRETYYESAEDSYAINTKPLLGDDRLAIKMFLQSVERGEQFEFDPDHAAVDGGSINYSDARLTTLGYGEPLNPSRQDAVSYALTIVVEP